MYIYLLGHKKLMNRNMFSLSGMAIAAVALFFCFKSYDWKFKKLLLLEEEVYR
jgi:hypothetical protein